jgi:hypothetical protein
MMPRPVVLAGLLVVGLFSGGCSSAGGGQPAASSAVSAAASPSAPSRTPLQELLAGAPGEKSPIYRYAIKSSGDPRSGVIDEADKMAAIGHTQYFTSPKHTEITTTLFTRSKTWVKVKFVPDAPAGELLVPKQWMSLDPKKLKYGDGTPFVFAGDIDPAAIHDILGAVTEVDESSPGHFAGEADLNTLEDGDEVVSDAQLKALGAKAGHVPFAAVLDAQGRLTTASLRLPAAGKYKAGIYEVTYDRYGTAAKPKLPAASDQTKAPSFVYDWYR